MTVSVASSRRVRSLAAAALAVLMAGALAGCKTTGSTDTTGSISSGPAPRSEADWRRESETLRRALPRQSARCRQRDPLRPGAARDRPARAGGRRAGDRPRSTIPEHKPLLGAYGRALADAGNFKQALDVLERAHSPDQPDWRILSVQGAVLDQMGRHEEAQRYYASALRIVPDEPSVLSNLGLSYALSKDLPARRGDAAARRRARGSTDKRVRQNLALVVGLQGRFQEAETIARADLPPDQAAENVAYLRRMLAEQNSWKSAPA